MNATVQDLLEQARKEDDLADLLISRNLPVSADAAIERARALRLQARELQDRGQP